MTQINPPINNFNGGLLGKLLEARVDLPFYAKGASIMLNFWAMVHGPMTRRPPLEFVAAFDDSTKKGRQFPFVYTVAQSYNMLMTSNGLALYANDARITIPAVTAAISGGDFATATPNEASGKTVTVSTTASGAAANLVDGSGSTEWVSDATATQWVKIDLASAKTIRFIWLKASATTPENAPGTWQLEGSATGAFAGEETVLKIVAGDSAWAANERRRFTVTSPGSYRYYRVNITATAGTSPTPTPGGGTDTGGGIDYGYGGGGP